MSIFRFLTRNVQHSSQPIILKKYNFKNDIKDEKFIVIIFTLPVAKDTQENDLSNQKR